MSISTSAAQAAARAHHGSGTGAGPAPKAGEFRRRRVVEASVAGTRESAQGRTDTGSGGTHRSLDARLETAMSSLVIRPDQGAPHRQEAPAGNPRVGVGRKPHSGLPDRPWLTPDRNAELRIADRHITELLDQPGLPPDRKKKLSAAALAVAGFEQDILRVDALLKRSRKELLTDAEWKELSDLASEAGQNLWVIDAEWGAVLGRLADSGALGVFEAEALRRRLDHARGYLYSEDMPWEESVRRVGTVLPVGSREPVVVDSRIVPGAALGAHFHKGYPGEDNADPRCPSRYVHLPRLEQSVLTDADGQRLFAGLRHRFDHAIELTDRLFLARISDDELKALLRELYVPEWSPWHDDSRRFPEQVREQVREGILDKVCRQTRGSLAWHHANAMCVGALQRIGREVAAAALVADSNKFRRALDGETVDLKLFSVALLSPRDHDFVERHRHRLLDWQGSLTMLDSDGAPCKVRVNVKARNFYLSARECPPGASDMDNHNVDAFELLGSADTRKLGGDVRDRVDAMNASALEMLHELRALGWQHSRRVSARGADDADVRRIGRRLSELENSMGRLERNARALEEAGEQLKSMWMERRGWPDGVDGHKHAAARLALVAHLMGEVPLLKCPSGTDFTECLDPEIKFLATVAAKGNGHLPPVDRDPEIWGRARSDFRPQ